MALSGGFSSPFGSFVDGLFTGAQDVNSLLDAREKLRQQADQRTAAEDARNQTQQQQDWNNWYDQMGGNNAFYMPSNAPDTAAATPPPTATPSTGGPATGGWGPMGDQVIDTLKQRGWDAGAIQGTAANLLAEGATGGNDPWVQSGVINPYGRREESYSPFQLHRGGELDEYNKWLRNHPEVTDPHSIPAITNFYAEQMENRVPGFAQLTDPTAATKAALNNFFRPLGYQNATRAGFVPQAQQVYNTRIATPGGPVVFGPPSALAGGAGPGIPTPPTPAQQTTTTALPTSQGTENVPTAPEPSPGVQPAATPSPAPTDTNRAPRPAANANYDIPNINPNDPNQMVFFGDSLARHALAFNPGIGAGTIGMDPGRDTYPSAVPGRNTDQVLARLNAQPDGSMPGHPIVISTGASNEYGPQHGKNAPGTGLTDNQLSTIQKEIDKAKRINNNGPVYLMGVANQAGPESGYNFDVTAVNPQLRKLAKDNGIGFTGEINTKGIHPVRSYYQNDLPGGISRGYGKPTQTSALGGGEMEAVA